MKKYYINFMAVVILSMLQFAYSQSWGSVYIDKNSGIAGGSYDASNRREAERLAEGSCIKKHQKQRLPYKCEFVGSFSNGCNAIFWSSDNKRAGWGSAFSQNDAEILARNTCIKTGGKDCTLRISFCTTRIMY